MTINSQINWQRYRRDLNVFYSLFHIIAFAIKESMNFFHIWRALKNVENLEGLKCVYSSAKCLISKKNASIEGTRNISVFHGKMSIFANFVKPLSNSDGKIPIVGRRNGTFSLYRVFLFFHRNNCLTAKHMRCVAIYVCFCAI